MDDELLKVEQVLLLENLTYLANKDEVMFDLATIQQNQEGDVLTVRKIVSKIEIDKLDENVDYTTLQNGEDWRNVLNAVLADDTLLDMKMIAVKKGSEKTGGTAAVFFNEKTGEVVVAFRGTEKDEWRDNFVGGAATIFEKGAENVNHDGVSTRYQEEALKWYQELDLPKLTNLEISKITITVTGHSKGGNKAKYITILDDSVSRCLSFDGQGFSDEFFEEYERRIAERACVISNHNVDFDYVNPLLNDVGEKTYYVGNGYGRGLVGEGHCPDTFLHYENGEAKMVIADGPAEIMVELDKFFNSYLRRLPEDKKIEAMDLVGELVEAFFKGEFKDGSKKITEIIDGKEEGWATVYDLATYTVDYIQKHPEFVTALENGAIEFGLDLFLPDKFGTMVVKLKKMNDLTSPKNLLNNASSLVTGIMEGTRYDDLQIPSSCRPLERNRVFNMGEMLEIGERGRSLMQVGSKACREWDRQLSRLEGLLDCLPSEVDASGLKSVLAQRGGPFYSDEYEKMGILMYSTTNRIVKDMQRYDMDAAQKINEVTENLDAITLNIKKLQERIL
ncbi:MAG: DUF2974 domain-containing protein [Lachnospiraceae bacterium]|nr:DUF2974 domain-containing protein [Lachnospiraceae bacterium]